MSVQDDSFKLMLDDFKKKLTPEEIIEIIRIFIPDICYEMYDSYILLPTICHHLKQEDGSLKLYYYFNTQLFFCYTQCGSSFDIYELIKKMLLLRNQQDDFGEILRVITLNHNFDFTPQEEEYRSILEKFAVKKQFADYKEYNSNVLASFKDYYHESWIKDGISISSMQKYGIKYSISKEEIIIPHYDINSRLIGIRKRNLDPIKIQDEGKYRPILVENTLYTHPLSYNLYGINFCKEAIQRTERAVIVEGEKSTLLGDTWYGNENIIVASCGKKLNKFQINLLIKLGVRDLTICYDRMNFDDKTDDSYFKELWTLCKKYSNYMNMYFIFDGQHILDFKAAPLDNGKEVFENLLSKRIVV